MRVLVIGASGPLGREIVKTTLARGHHVTAFVRRGFEMKHERLTVAAGDVMESETLDRPMAGKEAVICSLGVPATWATRGLHVELFSEGTSHIVRCMTRHNTRRFLCITGIGAGDSKGHGGLLYNKIIQPLLLKKIYEDKTRQEELVRYCNRDWVVVRPARLTDGPAEGRYAMLKDNRGVQTTSISRADVAAFCADQLVSNKFLYQFPILTNE
jgi:putative NADH-flavin reductase